MQAGDKVARIAGTAREGDSEAEKGLATLVLVSAHRQLQHSHQREGLASRAGFSSLLYRQIFYILGIEPTSALPLAL